MWKTNEADLASRQVMRAVARHDARSPTEAWIAGLGDESDRALEAIAEIITVVEVFTTETMIEVSEQLAKDAQPPVRRVALAAGRKEAEGSWVSRRDFAKNWTGKSWGDKAWFREWLGYVEARNAWAHGHGTLTRMQQGRTDVLDLLKSADVGVSGTRVLLSALDVRRCGDSALRLVGELDEMLRQHRLPRPS